MSLDLRYQVLALKVVCNAISDIWISDTYYHTYLVTMETKVEMLANASV